MSNFEPELHVPFFDNALDVQLRAGLVTRYHTMHHIHDQNVAAHSWGAAMMALYCWPDRPQIVQACLLHDIAEQFTGDMPAPTKWAAPEINEALERLEAEVEHRIGVDMPDLSPPDLNRFKVCDYAELSHWCLNERRLGNLGTKFMFHGVLEMAGQKIQAIKGADRHGGDDVAFLFGNWMHLEWTRTEQL